MAQFQWITRGSAARIHVVEQDAEPTHDTEFHNKMQEGRRWCDTSMHLVGYDIETGSVQVTTGPFCTNTAGLGFSFVLTLDKGSKVVVSQRSMLTCNPGVWSVSVNDGVEPGEIGEYGSILWGQAIQRGMREGLGLVRTRDAWTDACTILGTYAVDTGVGVGVWVDGSRVGVSAPEVVSSHRHAERGWEVDPVVVQLHPVVLDCVAPSSQWAPGALPLLYDVSARVQHAR